MIELKSIENLKKEVLEKLGLQYKGFSIDIDEKDSRFKSLDIHFN